MRTNGSVLPNALEKIKWRDFVENGLNLEASVQVAGMLETAGIDAIELRGGLLNNPNIMGSKMNSGYRIQYLKKQ